MPLLILHPLRGLGFWLGLLFVHLGLGRFWDELSKFTLSLGFHRGRINVILALHQCLESLFCNFRRIICVLSFRAHLGVIHACTMEEVGVGRAWLQSRNGDSGVPEFV